eukprot:11616971-Ditylum_brightwellii.AAC.1
MEVSESESEYEGTNTQIDEKWDAHSSNSESDNVIDQSYDSDKAAELLTSKFGFSRSTNNEQKVSTDDDAYSINNDDNNGNTKLSPKNKK